MITFEWQYRQKGEDKDSILTCLDDGKGKVTILTWKEGDGMHKLDFDPETPYTCMEELVELHGTTDTFIMIY